jgi:hypothetical protein
MGKTINLVLPPSTVLSSVLVFATEQMGDSLFLNGKKYFTYTYPLQAFLLENLERLPQSNAGRTEAGALSFTCWSAIPLSCCSQVFCSVIA